MDSTVETPPPTYQEADRSDNTSDTPNDVINYLISSNALSEAHGDMRDFSTRALIKKEEKIFAELQFCRAHLGLAKLQLAHIKPENYGLMRTVNMEIMRFQHHIQDCLTRLGTVTAAFHTRIDDGTL